jgi:hypothetical protein
MATDDSVYLYYLLSKSTSELVLNMRSSLRLRAELLALGHNECLLRIVAAS